MFYTLCALMVLFCHSPHLWVASRLVRTSLLVFENLEENFEVLGYKDNVGGKKY